MNCRRTEKTFKMPSAKRPNFFGPWLLNRSESSGNISVSPTIINNANVYAKTAPNSPIHSPNSQSPPSPSSIAHHSQLKRHFSSTFMLIPEDAELREINDSKSLYAASYRTVTAKSSNEKYPDSSLHFILRLIFWWPLLIISVCQRILDFSMLKLDTINPTPTFWFSIVLWIFWKLISVPLAVMKYILVVLHTPSYERRRRKRTVLISCGSTVQSLHLARNFHSAGARVVVFEFEGLFALARFSTAVDKFYTIPKVGTENVNIYISSLVDIIEKEKPSLYIPVAATSPAYYDALAKPHVELAGCEKVFSPGGQEVSILDDIGQVLRKCEKQNIPVPPYHILSSKEDLLQLYDNGFMNTYRTVLVSTGLNGIIERQKLILPTNKRDLKIPFEISDEKQWIVIRDVPGKHFVTCTTVKDSKVIANVTCRIQSETRNLMPEENAEIEKWLHEFFDKVRLMRSINGHLSFRFVKSEATGDLLTLGTRVGVTLSYLCYTGVQPRVVAKPCPHFERRNSGPMTQSKHFLPQTVAETLKKPSPESIKKLVGNVLNQREALFVFNDPLPYIAFYHFQLPLQKVSNVLKRYTSKHNTVAGL